MIPGALRARGDIVAALLLLALAAGQVAVRETYHQAAAQAGNALLLAASSAVILLGGLISQIAAPAKWREAFDRFAVVLAIVASADIFIGGTLRGLATRMDWPWLPLTAGVVLPLVLLGLASRIERGLWGRCRTAVLGGAFLFVGSQPLLMRAFVHDAAWPALAPADAGSQGAPMAMQGAMTAHVFVLLDELNHRDIAPIEAALRGAGLQVSSQPLTTVGDVTAKAIPALLSGMDFSLARPCGSTSICSGSHVLDFSRLRATRADIDVVGFYHPYCDIVGLRWCRRGTISMDLFDADEWRCAVWYRTGWPPATRPEHCAEVFGHGMVAMTDELVQAFLAAPVWERGGMLFAHLPLPHPPMRGGGRNLQEDYLGNIGRAAAVIEAAAMRARRGGLLDVRFVIFSDHPFRQRLWCSFYAPYGVDGCRIDPNLEDMYVPLIVAGRQLPRTEDIASNGDVFRLLYRSWQGGPDLTRTPMTGGADPPRPSSQ